MEQLFPYQLIGAQWLARMDQALLADEMGLGKSAQAVTAADMVGAQDILVVSPAAVRVNWLREFYRFSPLDRTETLLANGADRPRSGLNVVSFDLLAPLDVQTALVKLERFTWLADNVRKHLADPKPTPLVLDRRDKLCAAIVDAKPELVGEASPDNPIFLLDHSVAIITSRSENIKQLAQQSKVRERFIEALCARTWDVLIVDEAHFLKERGAGRTKTIYGRLMARAKRVWRLTGTPAPNDASELFPHLKSAGLITMNHTDFTQRYCTGFDGAYGYKVTGHQNTEELKALLAKFMLRRKKSEVMKELPPITFHEVTVEPSPVEMDPTFYEQWRTIGVPAFLEKLKQDDTTLKSALGAIKEHQGVRHHAGADDERLALLQALGLPMTSLRRYIGMAKLPAVVDIIKSELESGAVDKIVIFAWHQCVIEGLRSQLTRFKPVTLYGGTPDAKRQANVDKFQKDPRCRVFIGNIAAAGTGITLTAAHEVVFVEADWVPGPNAQAAMRCHRIGQINPVRVRFFTCAGSVDEQVMRTVRRKTTELLKIL